MKIDVVCPLYKAEKYIDSFIKNLQLQRGIELVKVVFPITQSDDDSYVIQKITEAGFTYFLVPKEEFSHSLTREKALYDFCESDVVLMISQDVVLLNKDSVYELVKNVNEEVVYAYGKQICRKKTIEHYVRQKNYGDESYVISKDDIEEMQLKAFFASDAFSAYHRPTFIALGGYDHVHMMMNEDMYYSKKVLDNGYKKAYVATAFAEHSHKLKLKQLYNRYYETGKWFKAHPEFDNYKTTDSGMKLALYIFKKSFKEFNIPVLIKFLPNMSARYLGMRKGRREK